MGAIADAFNTAWRDYVVDGVGASGENEPDKDECRDCGSAIETYLLNPIVTTLQVTTTFDYGTYSATGATVGIAINGANLIHTSVDAATAKNHLRFYNTNGLVGTIQTSGSATSFNTSSDQRLKKNFRKFDAGEILDRLNVYHFDWRKDGGGAGYGVKAQEANEVFPDAVSHDEDEDRWATDYSKFVPLLLQEVKALRSRVAALESAK